MKTEAFQVKQLTVVLVYYKNKASLSGEERIKLVYTGQWFIQANGE